MRLRMRSLFPVVYLLVFVMVFACTSKLVASQAQSQMRQMASTAAQEPIKLEVQSDKRSAPINSEVGVKVFLRNANNQPATWNRPCTVNLEITFPSKKVEKHTLVIPASQNAIPFVFTASEYGVTQLRATESTNSLLPAGNTVFIFAPRPRPHAAPPKSPSPGAAILESPNLSIASSRLVFASWKVPLSPPALPAQTQEPSAVASSPVQLPPAPQLLVVNSTGKDDVLADGKDFARISVYYMHPNGIGAPSDIHLWMTWSNGNFSPQPLIIHQGEFAADGTLVSSSPVLASVTLASSAPNVPVQGNSTLKINFAPPIYGFGPATSDSLIKMSLIDREPLVCCFFNEQGQCISTDRARHVDFSSSNPTLHVNPGSLDIPANNGSAIVYLEPTWRGAASIEMWTSGYNRQHINIDISIWLVLLLCFVGGAIGGLVAQRTSGGSLIWRPLIGIVTGIVLVWAVVFLVVFQTSSAYAHNLVSVFVVGILGGFGGTKVLDGVLKKIGI